MIVQENQFQIFCECLNWNFMAIIIFVQEPYRWDKIRRPYNNINSMVTNHAHLSHISPHVLKYFSPKKLKAQNRKVYKIFLNQSKND